MDQFKSNYERSIKIPGQRPSQLDVGQLELRPERHLGKQRQAQEQPQALAHAHRRLLGFFYVYAILIASLYLTYAAYYFYQQHQLSRLQLVQPSSASQAEPLLSQSEVDLEPKQQVEKEVHFEPILLNEKLEGKLHLLERYVEMIAIDLQETKAKLREREKCDCALSCTFNGTQYADRSSWSNQCDICTCQSGKISCTPQKCPKTNCDDPIQLPGQCCPTCMKRCKHNNGLLKHGQKFTTQEGKKECRCKDGLIKCESLLLNRQIQRPASMVIPVASVLRNRTTDLPPIDTLSSPEH